MTTLSLILMAVSAASVLAESAVYFREQFEDAGEDFFFNALLFCCYLYENVDILI